MPEENKIVVIANTKGGSGKSTVATNFACITAGKMIDGRRAEVLLVDADDQETAADFTAARKQDHPDAPAYTCIKLTGKAVRTETLELAPKYDYVIIDTGGRDTTSQRAALSVADILLVPCFPRSFDVWSISNVNHLVEEMRQVNPKLQAYVFLNRADAAGQGRENAEAIELLRETGSLTFLDAPIGSRKAFAHAASQGLAVTELTGKHYNAKAAEEMTALHQRCFDVTITSDQSQKTAVG